MGENSPVYYTLFAQIVQRFGQFCNPKLDDLFLYSSLAIEVDCTRQMR